MNEITLSNNLAQIELEINHHKQILGTWSVFGMAGKDEHRANRSS